MSGFVVANVDGVEHRIPQSWITGFCRSQAGLPAKTTAEAVRWWHEQRQREQQAATERRP